MGQIFQSRQSSDKHKPSDFSLHDGLGQGLTRMRRTQRFVLHKGRLLARRSSSVSTLNLTKWSFGFKSNDELSKMEDSEVHESLWFPEKPRPTYDRKNTLDRIIEDEPLGEDEPSPPIVFRDINYGLKGGYDGRSWTHSSATTERDDRTSIDTIGMAV
jgi:hypothetical protein